MNEQGSSPEMQSSTHSQQSKSPHHFPLSVHVDIHRIESNITFGDVVEKIIPDFFEINKKSATQFDMPLPEGFANTTKFWKVLFFAVVIGLFMGTLGECFLNIVDETPLQWVNNNSFANYADFYPYTGQLYWIAVTTGGGFTVGLIRWLTKFPDKLKTLYTDIQAGHVEYEFMPVTLLLCMISLCCGATLGPELGLGNVGGGLATLVTERVSFIKVLPEEDRKLLVLAGIAGALGGLFVSPMLSVLMVLELGKFTKAYMEAVMMLGCAAVAGFTVAYALIGVTWESYRGTWTILAFEWDFNLWNLWDAFVIGVFAAVFSFIFIIMLGISRQFFGRLRLFLSFSPCLKNVVPPTLGGLMIGVTNYCLPMTIGYGKLVNVPLVTAGLKQQLPQWLYIQSGFARMALLVISMTSGLVGGLGYPILTMGFIAATVTHLQYPNIPPALCLSCWMASAPLGLIPMPYTFVTLACLTFQLDPYQSSAVFVSALTSYLILSGSGISSTLEKQEKDHGSATVATAAMTAAVLDSVNAAVSTAVNFQNRNEHTMESKHNDYIPVDSSSFTIGDRSQKHILLKETSDINESHIGIGPSTEFDNDIEMK